MPPEFVSYRKIPRLIRPITITEKIDGTNGVVHVAESGEVTAGSRNRWITPEKDNYGFAKWVAKHELELRGLGPGYHFGEWWGSGIQRRYGLDHKRFSLFNVSEWNAENPPPECCHVVPTLMVTRDDFKPCMSDHFIHIAISTLRMHGSEAAPGFMHPEGIVVLHEASGHLYKVTLENDGAPKGLAKTSEE